MLCIFCKNSYITFRMNHVYIRIRGLCPRNLLNLLSELMYFYWKICYFGHFVYTAPGQPGGGGQDFIRRGRVPLAHAGYGPVWSTVRWNVKQSSFKLKFHLNITLKFELNVLSLSHCLYSNAYKCTHMHVMSLWMWFETSKLIRGKTQTEGGEVASSVPEANNEFDRVISYLYYSNWLIIDTIIR